MSKFKRVMAGINWTPCRPCRFITEVRMRNRRVLLVQDADGEWAFRFAKLRKDGTVQYTTLPVSKEALCAMRYLIDRAGIDADKCGITYRKGR